MSDKNKSQGGKPQQQGDDSQKQPQQGQQNNRSDGRKNCPTDDKSVNTGMPQPSNVSQR